MNKRVVELAKFVMHMFHLFSLFHFNVYGFYGEYYTYVQQFIKKNMKSTSKSGFVGLCNYQVLVKISNTNFIRNHQQ